MAIVTDTVAIFDGQNWVGLQSGGTVPVALDQEEAWRLFTRGTTPEAARAWAMLDGDATLAARALETRSVIAKQ